MPLIVAWLSIYTQSKSFFSFSILVRSLFVSYAVYIFQKDFNCLILKLLVSNLSFIDNE